MLKNIYNLGDSALYCDFGNDVSKEINLNVIKYFQILKNNKIDGITNLAPSYNKLVITFDLDKVNFNEMKDKILNLKLTNVSLGQMKNISIPVCFDDEFSLDMNRLTNKLNKSKKSIINLLLDNSYFCYMTGFIAGMPFLGDINKSIKMDRLETPRVNVPKGSIGITEQFCNIYTFDSPGGWNILGKTPLEIFDTSNEKKPNLIDPGDQVTFYEISKKEFIKKKDE